MADIMKDSPVWADKEISKDIWDYFTFYMSKRRISQAKLSKLIGVSPSTITNWKEDSRKIPLEMFIRIWIKLEIPPDKFLEELRESYKKHSKVI